MTRLKAEVASRRRGKLKGLSILLALALALSLSLVAAVPAGAQGTTVVLGGDVATAVGAQGSSDKYHMGSGCWQAVPGDSTAEGKMELYIPPTVAPFDSLGEFTIDEIASISYWTNKPGAQGDPDFYLAIYTVPDGGDDWYGYRLNAEPLYSNNLDAPANQWNQWKTGDGTNQLTFFDSNRTVAGFYNGPTLADLQTGSINWGNYLTSGSTDTIDYGAETVKYITFQTGTGWMDTFDGYIDEITISLTGGASVTIDLEEYYSEVWVDDDAAGDWYALPGNFDNIQDGIDNVAVGGTVHVAAGTYNPTSTIVINKDNLVLQGPQSNVDPRPSEGSTRTAGSAQEAIIDDDDHGLVNIILIKADNVVINGLEVKSGKGDMIFQGDVHSGTTVKYCIIHDGCGDEGAQLKKCTNGILEYNYVYDIASPGDALNISDDSTNGKIRYNEVRDIGSENAAIYVYGSTDMEIVGNLVYDVSQNDAIKLGAKGGGDASKTGGVIKDNVIYDVAQDGITVYMSGVTVEGNEIYDSSSENGAIYLAYGITDIVIQNNSVHDNGLSTSKRFTAAGILLESRVDAASVHINNNNIYNNTPYGVNNDASAVVDASDNWWGSADPTTVAGMVDGLVDFTPLVESGTDTDPAAGFQPDLSSLTVHTLGEQTGTTGRIQEGIDLVTGSTVNVAAGTYNLEASIRVDKPVSIIGDINNPENVIINAGTIPINSGPKPPDRDKDGFQVAANDVVIKGFKIMNARSVLTGIGDGWQNCGITIGGDITLIDWLDPYNEPILIDGGTFSNNIVENCTNGIYLAMAKNVTVSNNIVRNCTTDRPGADGVGIINWNTEAWGEGNYQDPTGNVIESNIVENCQRIGICLGAWGERFSVAGTVIRNNTIRNASEWAGIALMYIDGPLGIMGNNILDNPVGVAILGGDANCTDVSVNFNNITGNTNYGVETASPNVVDATNNWWGSASGPTHASNTYTVPAGDVQGDAVSDNVDFVPWLDAAAPGGNSFAPVNNVNTSEQFSSIQAAIDDVATVAGDTIEVAAGTYNEVVKIGKPLTLLGAQAGVDARIRTGPESIIDPNNPGGGAGYSWVVRVKSSDVTVDGFTVQNPTLEYGSAGLFCVEAPEENPYQNLVFRNNILQNPGIKTSHSTDWGKFGYDIGYCDNVLIEYNYIRDILCDTATPWNGTAGIWPWNMNNLTIRYNKIEHVTTFGIGLSDTNKNVLIFENEVSLGDPGEGAVPSVRTAGIRVGPVENYDVRIEGNSVSDCPGTVEKPGAGIRIQSLQAYDTGSTLAIDNVVTGCPVGIDARNHIENSTTLAGNRINGCDIGIRLIEGAAAPQVDGNTFEDNNPIQVLDEAEVLDIQLVLDTNTFYRAVVVYHPDASLLHTIWSNIQDAIDVAKQGDTVKVAAGTYTADGLVADIYKSSLTLKSTDGPEVTIIQSAGTEGDGAVRIRGADDGTPTTGVTVDGFTVYNTGTANSGAGIFIGAWFAGDMDHPASDNTVKNCIIGSATDQSLSPTNGVYLWNTTGNLIQSNIIYKARNEPDNFGCGIMAWGGLVGQAAPSPNTQIIDNKIYDSDRYGVFIGAGSQQNFDNMIVRGNTITGSSGAPGIGLWNVLGCDTIHINFNNIYDNGVGGMGISDCDALVDATNNWWGANDGPSGGEVDPLTGTVANGSGDKVSANVHFDPWTGAGVAASKTEGTEPGDDTVDATDEADTVVEKSGTGTPTVTVAKYEDNPGSGFGGDVGKYIDVHIDSDEDVTQLEIRLSYTDAEVAGRDESSLRLRWWDGDSWEACSDSGVDTAANYMWVKVRDDTRPSLSQLTGTPFAGRGTTAPVGVVDVGPPTRYLRVDFLGEISKMRLGDNNRLRDTLIALSPDGRLSLEIEEGTLALVDGKRIYLIEIREAEECPPLPEDTIVAGKVYDITPSGATFDKDIILILGFNPMELPENTVSVTMAYYVSDEGWVELESEPGGVAELGTMTAAVNHFTPFAILAKLAPPAPPPVPAPPPTLPAAHFVASGLTIEPSAREIWEPITFVTRTGESVTITANVANDGGQEGTYTVELKINGETVDSKEVTLAAGQSQQVSFALPGMDYGRYEVEVAGLSGEFTASRIINWWLIIGIIAAIGLITWGVIRGRRRVYS